MKSSEDMTQARKGVQAEEKLVRHAGDDRASGSGRFSLMRAFGCAWAGIRYAFTSQRNLKIHCVFALAAVVLGLILRISEAGWLAVICCIMVVMALEVVNTAIESVVDLASPGYHELARHAKDCAAGAVYIAALGSIIVAAVVFLPRIVARIS